jgi:ribonuclease HI
MVKIIQINMGKSLSAPGYLNNLIDDEGYEIALIQEPYTSNRIIGKLHSQGRAYSNCAGNESPRACIWVNNNFANKNEVIQMLEFSDKDCVAMKLKLNEIGGKREIIICSAYFPGILENRTNVISEKLNNLITYSKNERIEIIVGCDANAHNIVWGSKKDCSRGKILLEYLTTKNLYLINEGNAPTWEKNQLQDVIDITFASLNLSRLTQEWKVLKQDSGSDHNFISMEIKTIITEREKYRSKKKTKWIGFRSSVKSFLSIPMGHIEDVEDLDHEAHYLTTALIESYHNNCEVTYRNGKHKMKWQTPALLREKKRVQQLHNRAKRKMTDEDAWREWRLKRNSYNKNCAKASSDCWKKDMAELETISEAARLQKILENRGNKNLGTLRRGDGTYARNCEENNIELLTTHFPDCEVIHNNEDEEITTHTNCHNSPEDDEYIENITTMEKIQWAVNSFSPYKSPGGDKIFPALLQKSFDIIGKRLQTLFRESLKFSYIPKVWRSTQVVFIPKAGRPSYDIAKAYRPISLMSFILKTLEKLLDKNIRIHDIKDTGLSPKQFAYQEGKGTETALHDIITTIEESFKKRETAIAVFIDIEGAFDNTAFSIIENAARDKGINPVAIEWIKAMLKNRVIRARSETSRIKIRPVRGCPQGGCLSPLLWCLVVDSLINELENEGCHVTAYADDLALVVQGVTATEACEKMNRMMRILESWCIRNLLHVNPAKTTMVRFTRCRAEHKIKMEQVKLFNEPLKLEGWFKYLGVYLDSKLLMNKHIDECVSKGLRSLWATRAMVARTWGLTPQIAAWIYKQVIIPRITYGSIIWWHRANLKTYSQKLNKIHRLALLMITGAMKSTPTLGMSAALDLLPLNIIIEIRAREGFERLKLNGTWRDIAEEYGHGKLAEQSNIEDQERYDNCSRIWNFGKNFKIEIPERGEWDSSLKNTHEPMAWYTDGSKNDVATGCGVYCEQAGINRSERLNEHTTVMQAETTALRLCAEEIIRLNITGRKIFIFSDSQAAIGAIGKSTVNTDTVRECVRKLNMAGRNNDITVSWVPGHSDNTGNDRADDLANRGTEIDEITMNTPIPGSLRRIKYKNLAIKLFKDLWNNQRGLKHSKLMMEPFKKGKIDLTKLKRRDLRVIIGILTGQSCLNKFLNRIGKVDSSMCRYCMEEEEDMKHLLMECPAFMRIRRNLLESENLTGNQLKEINPLQLIKFAKKTGIYDTFFRDIES